MHAHMAPCRCTSCMPIFRCAHTCGAYVLAQRWSPRTVSNSIMSPRFVSRRAASTHHASRHITRNAPTHFVSRRLMPSHFGSRHLTSAHCGARTALYYFVDARAPCCPAGVWSCPHASATHAKHVCVCAYISAHTQNWRDVTHAAPPTPARGGATPPPIWRRLRRLRHRSGSTSPGATQALQHLAVWVSAPCGDMAVSARTLGEVPAPLAHTLAQIQRRCLPSIQGMCAMFPVHPTVGPQPCRAPNRLAWRDPPLNLK